MIAYFAVAILAPLLVHLSAQIFGKETQIHEGSGNRLKWMAVSPFEIAALGTLVLFAGTRLNVGTDYDLYRRIYDSLWVHDWGWSIENSPQEVGFTLLSLAVKTAGGDARHLFLVASALTVCCAYAAIRLASPRPGLALATFILFASYLAPFNTVRQGLAVALFALAVVVVSRRWRVGLLLAILACLIHISALVALILYFTVSRLRVDRAGILIGLAVAAAGSRVILAVPALLSILRSLNERYSEYVMSGTTAGLGTVLLAFFHAGAAMLLLKGSDWTSRELSWVRFYALTGPLAMLGTSVPIATRLSEYTAIFLPFLIGQLVMSGRFKMLTRPSLIVLVGAGYMAMYLLNYGGLLPYRTWL
ncbi:EpsG family protein [Nocardioides dongkuii]|uniref:EpsG family protein n=1 Tax=Nocardioides dongkuii TaxID=2760089 RepID=UPI0015FB8916|nr:EpsG family protein [Nocardioides dongkuii]